MRALNLATRPFRSERLPRWLLGLATLAVLGVSFQHVRLLLDLRPSRISSRHAELARLENQAARLRRDAASLRSPAPDARTLAEWTALRDLVDRRLFSWTQLFGILEQTLPPGVRLASIAPQVEKGELSLEVSADARSNEEGLELIRRLEQRQEFFDVYPTSRSGEDGVLFQYRMRYVPPPAAHGTTAQAPSGPGTSSEAAP